MHSVRVLNTKLTRPFWVLNLFCEVDQNGEFVGKLNCSTNTSFQFLCLSVFFRQLRFFSRLMLYLLTVFVKMSLILMCNCLHLVIRALQLVKSR